MFKYIVMISMVFMFGCGSTVKPEEYALAEELCKVNGTVGKIGTGANTNEVVCKNGATFTYYRYETNLKVRVYDVKNGYQWKDIK